MTEYKCRSFKLVIVVLLWVRNASNSSFNMIKAYDFIFGCFFNFLWVYLFYLFTYRTKDIRCWFSFIKKGLAMITSLFSVFEPGSRLFSLSLNWLSTFLGLMCLPYIYWILPSRWLLLWTNVIKILHKEFKILLGKGRSSGTIVFVTLFRLIVFNNFLGLLPYVFTRSSHLVITLSLSLPLWITFMVFGWFYYSKHMFAHLVPRGTPGILIPFMVIIETVRNLIRPGTLAVRLAANIIAGHLLLTLLGRTGPNLVYSIVMVLVLCQIFLLILEFAVAIIQSYVFAVLRALYAREIN